MYCKDHLFIERLVSSCCITVILIGCLNFMSFLSKDAGCSSSAKFDRTFNLLHIYLLLSLAVMLPSKVSTSHTRWPGSSLYTQKPVVPVKFIFPLQLHHGWVASIHPKAPETLSHSVNQSKRRAYWPTHDFGVHHLRAGSSPQLLSLPLRPAQKQQAHLSSSLSNLHSFPGRHLETQKFSCPYLSQKFCPRSGQNSEARSQIISRRLQSVRIQNKES